MTKQRKTRVQKPTLIFLGLMLLISLCYFSASYFFNESILQSEFVLFHLLISAIPYLAVSVIFWAMQPITTWKKPFVITATTLIGSVVGFFVVLSTFYLPGSRNKAYVEGSICAPAVMKHYGVENITDLPPSHSAFDLGQTFYRWYAQQAECVDNFYRGKGPVFSENPPGFANVEGRTERIVLQDEYYLDVFVPEGYQLKDGAGDYAKYITDSKSKELIGFQKSSPGGELGTTHEVGINNVPLVSMYRSDFGCPINIFSEKIKFAPEKLYFGINTWCKDDTNTQDPIYEQVLESVVFSPKLKEMLLGTTPAPLLSSPDEYINFNGKRVKAIRVGEGEYCEGRVGLNDYDIAKCATGLKCQFREGTAQDAPGTCVKE
jgi:hypothetical protein